MDKLDNRNDSKKPFYHDSNEYFMAMAALAMKRSNRSAQVGACIIDSDERIVGIGYNELARGCVDNSQYPVCHAEANAIIHKTSDVRNGKIYTTLFPCNECAKLIIQSGIKTVIFLSTSNEKQSQRGVATNKMFDDAGVTYMQYKVQNKEIRITFND